MIISLYVDVSRLYLLIHRNTVLNIENICNNKHENPDMQTFMPIIFVTIANPVLYEQLSNFVVNLK